MAERFTYPVFEWSQDYPSTLGTSRGRPATRTQLPNGVAVEIPNDIQSTPAEVITLCESILKGAGVRANIVERPAPTWRPGDVVVVTYGPHRYASGPARGKYTYVRGRKAWLAEEGRPQKSDEWMTAQLDAGRAKPVLQAGGEPFEAGRL